MHMAFFGLPLKPLLRIFLQKERPHDVKFMLLIYQLEKKLLQKMP